MENDERYDSKVMRLSQNSIPRSYSNSGLPASDKIKKRGSSFTKLPLAHWNDKNILIIKRIKSYFNRLIHMIFDLFFLVIFLVSDIDYRI